MPGITWRTTALAISSPKSRRASLIKRRRCDISYQQQQAACDHRSNRDDPRHHSSRDRQPSTALSRASVYARSAYITKEKQKSEWTSCCCCCLPTVRSSLESSRRGLEVSPLSFRSEIRCHLRIGLYRQRVHVTSNKDAINRCSCLQVAAARGRSLSDTFRVCVCVFQLQSPSANRFACIAYRNRNQIAMFRPSFQVDF